MGVGNVAVDVARILVRTPEELARDELSGARLAERPDGQLEAETSPLSEVSGEAPTGARRRAWPGAGRSSVPRARRAEGTIPGRVERDGLPTPATWRATTSRSSRTRIR